MWLPIVICIGAIALLVGPIMMMQPSGADRRLAGLRTHALQQGLRVHMHAIPESADYKSRSKTAAMYCLPWKKQADTRVSWVLVRKNYSHEIHAFGTWDWQVEGPERLQKILRPHLNGLPDSVFAIISGAQGLCCLWSERGDEQAVEGLAHWLRAAAVDVSVG